MPDSTVSKFDVGGVLLDRPFKIRRLGHFGINAIDMDAALHFYRELLGFRITDVRDPFHGKPKPKELEPFGDCNGYFMRYGGDHHAFVIYNYRQRIATDTTGRFREGININQITWQVGSLGEVVAAHEWLASTGLNMLRAGRDMPGSNWHSYLYDPDGHTNELYYGIEQIGWTGHSKPWDMHYREMRDVPELPQISEFQEVQDALEKGIDLLSGQRDVETMPAKHDVGGVLLPRPFKIVKIGPVSLFVRDVDAAVAFYRDCLGFIVTEEADYQGLRCVFLRNNTEHHSLTLAPIGLREVLGMATHSTCMSFGLQLASYRQLRDALDFLARHGYEIRHLPPELTPGMDHTALCLDKDGQAVQLYYYMEQIGWDGHPRPAGERRAVDPDNWPDAVEPLADSFMGEPFLGPWG